MSLVDGMVQTATAAHKITSTYSSEKSLTDELYGSFGQGTPDEMEFDKDLYWERFLNEKDSTKRDHDYELREEYDLSQLPVMPTGRYDPKRRLGSNVIVLEPDVAQAFPDDTSVNNALRLVIEMAKLPQKQDPRTPT